MIAAPLVMVQELKVVLHSQIMAFTESPRNDAYMLEAFVMEIIYQVSEYTLMIVSNIKATFSVSFKFLIVFLSQWL